MAGPEKTSLMPKKGLQTLLFAIILGVIGIALMTFYLRGREKKIMTVSVAVATRQMAEGDTIKRGMVVARPLPGDAIGGRFVSGDDIIAVEGRVVSADLDPGQPLYWNAVALTAHGGYDRYLRPENRERAFAMNITGPPVRRGDVIDILGTHIEGGNRRAFEVLPAVTVIDNVKSTLVLSVTPEEQLLLLAAQPLNLVYSIRSKLEPDAEQTLQPVALTDVVPRARELARVRTERLREGTIRRDWP